MNRIEHLFVILAEEAAEVAQEASKCLRFSPEEIYAPIGISNAQRVIQEYYDLVAVVRMLQKEGALPGTLFSKREEMIEAKIEKVEKNLLYSLACGTLTGED